MSAVELSLTDIMDKIVMDDWGQAKAGPFGALRAHVDAGKLSEATLHAELGQIVAGLKPGPRARRRDRSCSGTAACRCRTSRSARRCSRRRARMGIGQTLRYADARDAAMLIANARMYSVTPSCKADWRALLGWVARTRRRLDWTDRSTTTPRRRWPPCGRAPTSAWRSCAACRSRNASRDADAASPRRVPSPAALRRQAGLLHRHRRRARDSPYRTLEDTFGSVVGYTLADSMSGGVALRDHLRALPHAATAAAVPRGVGNLIHARGVIEAIAAGTIDVGPLDSYCHDLLKHNDPLFAAQVRTVASTDARPIPPIVATAPISASELARLREALLEARHAP